MVPGASRASRGPRAVPRDLGGTRGGRVRARHPEWEAGAAAHGRFAERFPEAILGGGALHPAEAGTVLRVRGGEVLLTEGTFSESTEVIGGLYLLTADSSETITAIARELPMGPHGVVQIRPIVELDE